MARPPRGLIAKGAVCAICGRSPLVLVGADLPTQPNGECATCRAPYALTEDGGAFVLLVDDVDVRAMKAFWEQQRLPVNSAHARNCVDATRSEGEDRPAVEVFVRTGLGWACLSGDSEIRSAISLGDDANGTVVTVVRPLPPEVTR